MIMNKVITPKVRTAINSGHIQFIATRGSFAAFQFDTAGKLQGGFLENIIPVHGQAWTPLDYILPVMRSKDLYDMGYVCARYVCTTWLNELGGLEPRI